MFRSVMPELQVSMRRMIDDAVERAMAPVLAKQRELELAMAQLRRPVIEDEARTRTDVAEVTEVTEVTPELTAPPTLQEAADITVVDASLEQGAGVAALPVQPRAVRSMTIDTSPLADIPPELNGSRRRTTILWVLAVGVVLALVSAVTLSILSNQGTYF